MMLKAAVRAAKLTIGLPQMHSNVNTSFGARLEVEQHTRSLVQYIIWCVPSNVEQVLYTLKSSLSCLVFSCEKTEFPEESSGPL